MPLKFYIGLISFSLSICAILLNLLIFIPVFRLAFVSKKSTIYIIAFFNIISDLVQLVVTGFHLSASIMADRYILSEHRLDVMNFFWGGVFINAWYMECFVHIVMAVNRFVVITLKQNNIFTFKTTVLIFVFLFSLSTFSTICTQFLFPCCRFIPDHNSLSYILIPIEETYSYSNFMIVFYDISSVSISYTCYIAVFLTIRNTRKTAPINANRTHQDVKYLFHFVFISIFYILTWVSFELLPFIVPADQPEWFGAIPILIALNCSSNSIIYLFGNPEVQKMVQIPWIRKKLVRGASSSAAMTTAPATIPTN